MSAQRANRRRGVLKLLAPFLLLAALGFFLTAWIYTQRIGATLHEAEISRLQFTLKDLKVDFELGLAQGYGIRDLANAQSALEAEVQLDPDIDMIAVLDSDGAIVHQAGAQSHPRGEPAAVVELQGSEGRKAGSITAWQGERTRDVVIARAGTGLALAALCALLFTATAALATMAWLTRRRDEVLETIAESLEHPGRSEDPHIARMVDDVNQQASNTLVNIAAARHLFGQRDSGGGA